MRPTARLNLIVFLLFICSLTFGQIKSTKENHAPVFVKEMPDTVIDFGKIFKFTYKAIDEDNDKLLFTSVNPLPPRATLNDTTGVFSWKPLAGQGGKYEIIINVTDGKATTQSRKTKLLMIPTQIYHNEIKLASSPSDGGTPGVSSIWCNEEDTITVKAKANNGYRFMNWKENDSVVSKDSVYTFVVTKNRNLVANFRENHAPVFVKEMPDTTNLWGKNLVFTYRAIDPDGDSIKYYASAIFPSKAIVMASTGVFGWRSFSLDLRHNYIQVYVTDGIQSTLSRTAFVDVQGPTCCIEGFSLAIQTKPINGGVIIREIKKDTISLKAIANKGFIFSFWKENDSLLSLNSSYSFAFKSNIFSSEYKNIFAYFTEGNSIEEDKGLPMGFRLEQNYPNPFNPSTTIEYTIPVETRHGESLQHVSLKVYDVLGREVATLVDEYKQAGNYKATFNLKTLRATSLPSGVYFYQLRAGSFAETKKLCLIK